MGTVTINYGDLEDSISRAKRVQNGIDDYISEINKKIVFKNDDLSGNDSYGYVSTATNLAKQKITSLNAVSKKFETFRSGLETFINETKEIDGNVAKKINKIADANIAKRTWYQKAGDWIYNTFCVDIPNSNDILRNLCDIAKDVSNDISDWKNSIYEYFKYGDGKYILNIATSVLGTVVAVGGAIAAVCAIPFTGGATIPVVIGTVGAAAALISAGLTTFNSLAISISNVNALSKHDNPGVARYYGSTSTVNELISKYDFGNATINNALGGLGNVLDTTKTIADTVSLVCSIASLGNIKNASITKTGKSNINYSQAAMKRYNTKFEGYSFTPKNIMKNLRNEMGLTTSKGANSIFKKTTVTKGGQKIVKNKSFMTNIFAKNYTTEKMFTFRQYDKEIHETVRVIFSVPEKVVKVFRAAKVTKNITDNVNYVSNINDYLSTNEHNEEDNFDLFTSLTGLGSNTPFFKPLDSYVTKTGKSLNNILNFAGN